MLNLRQTVVPHESSDEVLYATTAEYSDLSDQGEYQLYEPTLEEREGLIVYLEDINGI